MIKIFRPYSVDDGHSYSAGSVPFDAAAPGILIGNGGWVHTRFRGIEIPQGSTINSATLRVPWTGKNNVAASIYSRLYWRAHAQVPNSLSSYSYPENQAYQQRAGYRTFSRVEGDTSDAGNWMTYDLLTEFSTFKTYMQSTNWTMHDSMTFSIQANSVTGTPDISFVGGRDSWQLIIDFTPPANPVRTEVQNYAVNPHAEYSQAYYHPWESNAALGNYPAPATVTRATMPDNSGLGVTTGWQVNWPVGEKTWTNHWAFNRVEFGEWYTFSAWCYVPTGAPDVLIDFLFQTVSKPVAIKNQWFRLSHKFLNTVPGNFIFVGIAPDKVATATGPHLYMTKVMFTHGEEQPGYFGGSVNQTGVGASQYTGNGEETRLYLPTLTKPTLNAVSTASTDDSSALTWTGAGSKARVQIERTA